MRTAGEWYGEEERDKGIMTPENYRFYAISSKFDQTFDNTGKDLILQFTIKYSRGVDCAGGYIKILPAGFDQDNFNGDTPYHIMFGPDFCGSTNRIHNIFTYKNTNHLWKKEPTAHKDQLTHMYRLVVHPDNTYQVFSDDKEVESGRLEDDWNMLPPKKIKDPDDEKPDEWVDEAKIVDVNDVKPDWWDSIPSMIPDPDAKKPDDWDDDEDGEWEAPMIPNPEFKGEWRPRMIDNPEYKGPWVQREIDNPDYAPDSNLYRYTDMGGIGIEVWQVTAGVIFDNIQVTDSLEEADEFKKKYFDSMVKEEEKMFKKKQEREEAKKREAEEEEETFHTAGA